MTTRLTRTLSLALLLAMLTLSALPAAAAPPAPPSAQALPASNHPAKVHPTRPDASRVKTADAATVDATWTSLMAVKAQFDTDSVEFALTSAEDVSQFVLATYGLAEPETRPGGPLDQDPDSDASTDPLGEGFELWPFTITEDDLRLVIQARNSEIDDLDMYVMRDANQDGFFDIDEELTNWSWNWDAEEQVDLRLPEPGDYLLAIHAYWGSGAYDLVYHRITTADQNGSAWMTDVPASLEAGAQYAMQYHWSRPIDPGKDYFGLITLGDESDSVALGFQRVNIMGSTPAVAKTANRDLVALGGLVNYEIMLTNAAQAARAVDLADAIPAQLAVDPGSISGGAVLANGSIIWNGQLPARGSVVQVAAANFPLGGYVSLASLGVAPMPVDSFLGGDDEQVRFEDLPAFRYLGNEYTALCMMSNGYLVVGGCRAEFHDIPYIPYGLPQLPAPTGPDNMIAPLWMDLDLASDDGYGGGHWYAATVNVGGADWLAFEWENAQRYDEPETAFTFQVWLKVGDDQVFLVYHQLDGDLATTVVGAENDDGTTGASYFYNDGEGTEIGTPPQPGVVLQVAGQDPPRPTHAISYWAQAQAEGEVANTVQVASGPAQDSATATVTVSDPTVNRSRRYTITQDTFVDGGRPGLNFGSAGTMWAGFQDLMRPVVWADIPVCDGSGCIPAGSSVDVAYLYLYVTEGRGYATWDQSRIDSVTARALLSPWTQDGATWVAPWQTAGGDFGPALASTHLGSGKVGSWLRFDVTAHVQQVVAGVSPNYGFVLTSEDDTWDPTEAINGVRYGLATSQYWDASKAGYLRVMYRTFTE